MFRIVTTYVITDKAFISYEMLCKTYYRSVMDRCILSTLRIRHL